MSDQVIGALIGGVSSVVGVVVGILLQYFLSTGEKKRQKQEYDNLYKKYIELLDSKAEHSKRKISFQLEVLENKISEVKDSGRTPDVWILGINATGPLHQGREILIDMLKSGGKLRVLLLDPTHPVFSKRSDHERDHVGRITAELFASFYILMDIMSQLKSANESLLRNIEVRLHHEDPDRSLIMVNCEDQDGVVLVNPYPSREGTRGVEGEMYPLVQRGRTASGYKENVTYYKKLWDQAKPVKIHVHDKRLQISEWPFSCT